MTPLEGDYQAARLGHYVIVQARFNSLVTEALCRGAVETFSHHGVTGERLEVVTVPGSFEIPLIAQSLAKTGRYQAVVCLGCIIRGETDHYDHVAGQAASGVLRAGLETNVPVIFGILTTDTVEQALNRAGLKQGNSGSSAAEAAIEMAALHIRITQVS